MAAGTAFDCELIEGSDGQAEGRGERGARSGTADCHAPKKERERGSEKSVRLYPMQVVGQPEQRVRVMSALQTGNV